VTNPSWYCDDWAAKTLPLPALLLQIDTSHSARVAEYLSEQFCVDIVSVSLQRNFKASNKSLLLVRPSATAAGEVAPMCAVADLARKLIIDTVMERSIRAMYVVQSRCVVTCSVTSNI
jgi:hypothetical protein